MQTLEIKMSPSRVLLLFLGGILMILICLWAGISAAGVIKLVGWFGVIFFGLATIAWPVAYFKNKMSSCSPTTAFTTPQQRFFLPRWFPWEHVANIEVAERPREIHVTRNNGARQIAIVTTAM
ncbi:hypothetical protein ACIP5Z_02425 [Rothia terrae]|uniref:hypothetical protein n=1 Tax=Rothia terrae TaxID=396015 RepID=UPI00340282D6